MAGSAGKSQFKITLVVEPKGISYTGKQRRRVLVESGAEMEVDLAGGRQSLGGAGIEAADCRRAMSEIRDRSPQGRALTNR